VADVGQRAQVDHVAARVADGLGVDGLGAPVDEASERGRVGRVGEPHLDAELGQGVGEQVVGAAVQRAGGDDVVTLLGDGEDGVGDGRLAGGQRQPGDAALECRDALFQHIRGRIHDPGVDVALDLEVEQVRTVLGAVEGVGRGLVDRHGHGLGDRIRGVAGVDGERFEFHGFSCRAA
jgi:hypothetical protein